MPTKPMDEARRAMVDGQVLVDNVTDRRILDAMAEIPREAYAPRSRRALVYAGAAVEIADGRYLTEPRSFARMAQALNASGDGVALLVGVGGGYGAAVLARLYTTVVGVECDERLAQTANSALAAQGVDNATVTVGPLEAGAPGEAPFDAILIDGAIATPPSNALLRQLRDGARLVAIEDDGRVGRGVAYIRNGEVFTRRTLFDANAPLLPGFAAQPEFVF